MELQGLRYRSGKGGHRRISDEAALSFGPALRSELDGCQCSAVAWILEALVMPIKTAAKCVQMACACLRGLRRSGSPHRMPGVAVSARQGDDLAAAKDEPEPANHTARVYGLGCARTA